jgi:hypothetical protein
MKKKLKELPKGALETFARFQVGEKFPAKGCWFSVAHVEEGVVVLAMAGFTGRGVECIAQMKAAQEKLHAELEKRVAEGVKQASGGDEGDSNVGN